eukprot:TRINITY_DN27117_c0_g1_i1.p1 TRINITY_DN27117_c0_g1~~TRINITY_DN27117_c0_g1_i1.p1  ORF type:complete len:528 (+),score=248.46 TRINITY_DN27117_c0_g1_i1:99-1682(+)
MTAPGDVDFFGNEMITNLPQTPGDKFRLRYRRIKVVGKGSFGEAVLVRSRDDGKRYITKTIDCTPMTEKDKLDVYREIKILADVNHPNIVRYKEHYEELNNLWIVMEYADGGDLAQRLKEQRKKATDDGHLYFDEQLIMMWFLQMCMALKHLHDNHILHRDVKTANIFLTSKNVVKLGDFGISTVLHDTMAVAHTVCGTPYYFSPEICQNKPYGSKSDVWALGIVLYEMVTLRRPFNAKGLKELMKKIVTGQIEPIPSHYNPQLAQLIAKLLNVHHSLRPTINRILESSYVQDSLRAFSQELAQQTERDKQIYDERRRQKKAQAPPPQASQPPAPTPLPPKKKSQEQVLGFEDIKKMDRAALKQALAAHKETAETEMAEAKNEQRQPSQPGQFLGMATGDADDSDGDDGHVVAKQSMKGKVDEFIAQPLPVDDEFTECDPQAVASVKMPNGDIVNKKNARSYLETEIGHDLLKSAVDFLNAKLSSDDPTSVVDAEVQGELAAILGLKKSYANIVSKLVLYEASADDE